jgi:hypothetical protein
LIIWTDSGRIKYGDYAGFLASAVVELPGMIGEMID